MAILKKIVFSVLPKALLKLVKREHFYHKIKNATVTEEEDLIMLNYIIRQGDHVLDIGANVGLYTKFMSQGAGKGGRVLSFEPIPETYRYLQNNIRKLKLENVTALNIAVSASKGTATMQIPLFSDSRPNFYEAAITDNQNAGLTSIDVKTDTIDAICSHYQINPSFIKCDVEGHEWSVFRGAENILTTYKPILLIEINSGFAEPNSNAAQLVSYLTKMGYDAYINDGNKLKMLQSDQKVNYYFLTSDHVQRLQGIIKG